MTLSEFLLARFAEDKARWKDYADAATDDLMAKAVAHRMTAYLAVHREIVKLHTCECPDPDCGDCGACSGDHHADPTPAPCATLRQLATIYADHPDYRAEEWRPDGDDLLPFDQLPDGHPR